MEKSWIALKLESYDYPYWNYSDKKVITGKEADAILQKYVK